MKNIAFKSTLKLNAKSRQFYSIPIAGTFRVSFWFSNSRSSSPCEISSDNLIGIDKNTSVLVNAGSNFEAQDLIKINEVYYIGLYPNQIIGEGIITETFL